MKCKSYEALVVGDKVLYWWGRRWFLILTIAKLTRGAFMGVHVSYDEIRKKMSKKQKLKSSAGLLIEFPAIQMDHHMLAPNEVIMIVDQK